MLAQSKISLRRQAFIVWTTLIIVFAILAGIAIHFAVTLHDREGRLAEFRKYAQEHKIKFSREHRDE